ASVTSRGLARAMTSTCSAVGTASRLRSCAPRNDGLMNGPSMWAPRTRAPSASAVATAPANSAPAATGDEMSVGRKAVTPVAGSAAEMAAIASRPSAASHPANPFTCRSMNPGASSSPSPSTISSSGRSDAGHSPAIRVAKPHEDARADHVEDDLLHGAGFQPGRSGYDLGAGLDLDGDIGKLAQRRVRRAAEPDNHRATRARLLHCREHVG